MGIALATLKYWSPDEQLGAVKLQTVHPQLGAVGEGKIVAVRLNSIMLIYFAALGCIHPVDDVNILFSSQYVV